MSKSKPDSQKHIPKYRILKGDEVVVISGKEKGKTGKVEKILTSAGRAVVSKLNIVKRNVRASQKNPSGGIIEKEASIHISNLMIYEAKTSSRVKTGYAEDSKDGKIRINRKTGKRI